MRADTRSESGLSLVEVILGLGILLGGIIGLITLSIASLKADEVSSRKIVAMNLAREGIEVIRNIRDSNWLAGRFDDCSATGSEPSDDWFSGFTDSSEPCASAPTEVLPLLDTATKTWSLFPNSWPTTAARRVYFTDEELYVQEDPFSLPPPTWGTIYARWVQLTPKDDTSGNPDDACTETVAGTCDRITYFDVLSTVTFTLNGRTNTVEVATRLSHWKP